MPGFTSPLSSTLYPQFLRKVALHNVSRNRAPAHLRPGPAPDLGDGGVFPASVAGLEGVKRGGAGFGVERLVDLLQRGGDGLAVLVGDEVEAVAKQWTMQV